MRVETKSQAIPLSATESPFFQCPPSSLPGSTCRAGPGLDQNKGEGHNFRNHSPAGDGPRPHMFAFSAGDLRSIEVEWQIQGHTVSGPLAYLWEHLEHIFYFPISRNSEQPRLVFLSSCGCYRALLSLVFMVFLFLSWLHSSGNV